jgi:hypothetical protein
MMTCLVETCSSTLQTCESGTVMYKSDEKILNNWCIKHCIIFTIALQPLFKTCPPLYWGFIITHNYTNGRIPLYKWSARRRDLYLHRTTQQTNIHALSGIRTCYSNIQAAEDLHVRQRCHRDWLVLTNYSRKISATKLSDNLFYIIKVFNFLRRWVLRWQTALWNIAPCTLVEDRLPTNLLSSFVNKLRWRFSNLSLFITSRLAIR